MLAAPAIVQQLVAVQAGDAERLVDDLRLQMLMGALSFGHVYAQFAQRATMCSIAFLTEGATVAPRRVASSRR